MKRSDTEALTIVGVRHHSPACARLARWTIERTRPRAVLIEGPADMNARMAELWLPHELPIAVFTYRSSAEGSQSSWTPLCAHSPEWVALQAARSIGAEARFIDLPAWHKAFWGVRNRYADRGPDRASRLVARLCERFAVSDADALWEHLFEQPMPEEELDRRLRQYFVELRADEPADERDATREEYMAGFIAAAMAEAEGPVVVVCGGYHAPALERMVAARGGTHVDPPALPEPPEGSRIGSYLVPYSFHSLDSFTGYESGMPSPAYQDASYREGVERAADELLEATVRRLRGRKQPVSPADVIAVASMAEGLRRLRGHAVATRVDLLDALAAALVKDALDVALPWTYRGTLLPRTDPMLVEVMAAFSGERVGRLAEGTPRPPLLEDVRAQLHAHDLSPARTARSVQLDLTHPPDVERSRILHRLRVLGIPGFVRQSGPTWATEGTLGEIWGLSALLETEAALIEAGAYGATLESAASARLEEAFLGGGGLDTLASLLAEAVFIGITTLADRILSRIATRVGAEPALGVLGEALGHLLGLWRHDTLLGSAGTSALAVVIEAAFDRGLWLVEGVQGASDPADVAHIAAVLALRDTLRHGRGRLQLEGGHASAVMRRRMNDADAPPSLRGAALGFLWSTGDFTSGETALQDAVGALRRAARPATVGDFLAGLFALAREEVSAAGDLVGAIDSVVGELPNPDFLVALPALRLAFSFFPPGEKETLATQVLRLHGGDAADARLLTRLATDAGVTAAGLSLDTEVTVVARRWGLHEPVEET